LYNYIFLCSTHIFTISHKRLADYISGCTSTVCVCLRWLWCWKMNPGPAHAKQMLYHLRCAPNLLFCFIFDKVSLNLPRPALNWSSSCLCYQSS
jgi:hypothetical protein